MKRERGIFFVCHVLPAIAAALAWIGDLLLGYVQPGAMGMYGKVQTGWSEVVYVRPMISMAIAAVAFPLFLPGLYAASRQMATVSLRSARIFLIFAVAACTGGLFIHAFFCVPQIIHRFLALEGWPDLALRLTDRIYAVLTPTIGITMLLYIAALGWLLVAVITGKTPYPRSCAAANPLSVAVITVPLWLSGRESAYLYAFMLGTPNLGMFLFFLVTAVYGHRMLKTNRRMPHIGL
jgi:hypothetical protein